MSCSAFFLFFYILLQIKLLSKATNFIPSQKFYQIIGSSHIFFICTLLFSYSVSDEIIFSFVPQPAIFSERIWFSCLFFSLFFVADLLNCLNKVIAQDFFFSTVSVWWHDLYSPARIRTVEFLLSDVWRRNSRKDAPHANWAVQVANSNQGRIKWLHSTLSLDFFARSSPSSRRRHKSHLVEFKAKDNIE